MITGLSINPIASPISAIATNIIQTSLALNSSSQAIANGILTTIIAHFRPNESIQTTTVQMKFNYVNTRTLFLPYLWSMPIRSIRTAHKHTQGFQSMRIEPVSMLVIRFYYAHSGGQSMREWQSLEMHCIGSYRITAYFLWLSPQTNTYEKNCIRNRIHGFDFFIKTNLC